MCEKNVTLHAFNLLKWTTNKRTAYRALVKSYRVLVQITQFGAARLGLCSESDYIYPFKSTKSRD